MGAEAIANAAGRFKNISDYASNDAISVFERYSSVCKLLMDSDQTGLGIMTLVKNDKSQSKDTNKCFPTD